MKLIILGFVGLVLVYWFTGGGLGTDKIFGPPDTLPFERYDDIDVNVYFYFEDDREVYLGQTHGASSCGRLAYSYASQQDLSRNDDWTYICCTMENGSSCYRKIR